MDRARDAEREIHAELVFGLVLAVASLGLQRPADGFRQSGVTDGISDVIRDALRIQYLIFVNASVFVFISGE